MQHVASIALHHILRETSGSLAASCSTCLPTLLVWQLVPSTQCTADLIELFCSLTNTHWWVYIKFAAMLQTKTLKEPQTWLNDLISNSIIDSYDFKSVWYRNVLGGIFLKNPNLAELSAVHFILFTPFWTSAPIYLCSLWYLAFTYCQKHRRQQQDDRIYKSFIIYGYLWERKTSVLWPSSRSEKLQTFALITRTEKVVTRERKKFE